MTPQGAIQRVEEDDGSLSTLVQIHVNAEVCTRAPTKAAFIEALGRLRPEPGAAIRVPERQWLQHVADRVVARCKHRGCDKPSAGLKLFSDCNHLAQRVVLDPERQWVASRASYAPAEVTCCKIDSEKTLGGPLADTYGYAAVKDIVEYEKRFSEATFLERKIQEARRRWKRVFVQEMCELLRQEQPQDISGYPGPRFQEESKE